MPSQEIEVAVTRSAWVGEVALKCGGEHPARADILKASIIERQWMRGAQERPAGAGRGGRKTRQSWQGDVVQGKS